MHVKIFCCCVCLFLFFFLLSRDDDIWRFIRKEKRKKLFAFYTAWRKTVSFFLSPFCIFFHIQTPFHAHSFPRMMQFAFLHYLLVFSGVSCINMLTPSPSFYSIHSFTFPSSFLCSFGFEHERKMLWSKNTTKMLQTFYLGRSLHRLGSGMVSC